ncbi:hypothetical protein Lal_00039603 [Lupinus albus]|nr:hypothetical protein Lal_00039603 [Lupinus albus]
MCGVIISLMRTFVPSSPARKESSSAKCSTTFLSGGCNVETDDKEKGSPSTVPFRTSLLETHRSKSKWIRLLAISSGGCGVEKIKSQYSQMGLQQILQLILG